MTENLKNIKLESQLQRLPHSPGVYIMKDMREKILYIGKASDLKKRVGSYFRENVKEIKTRFLMSKVHGLEFYNTANETEAFILEANLIQKEKPPYNLRLKDDKRYPYLALTSGAYPRLVVTRNKNDRYRSYFGPYTNNGAMRKTLDFIDKSFMLRKCDRSLAEGKVVGKPCLYFQIGQCKAPCTGSFPMSEYVLFVQEVESFLDGNYGKLLGELENKMSVFATALDFEHAAKLRDIIQSVKELDEKQNVNMENAGYTDAFHVVSKDGFFNLIVFFIRNEKITGRRNFIHEAKLPETNAEVLSDFVRQFYSESSELPDTVLIPFDIDDRDGLSAWLSGKFGKSVLVRKSDTENEQKFVRLLELNAGHQLDEFLIEKMEREKDRTLLDLREALDLPRMPFRIEAFDNSNLSGKNPVASMVSFRNGLPDKKNYRHFKIRTVEGIDDFATMTEVVGRRYQRVLNENLDLPDLILIDGGPQQLKSAMKSLHALGIKNVPVIGLAKREEEIYRPGIKEPVVLSKDSKALQLLQRVRDEAHRFAVTFHKKLRDKDFIPKK
jgi:excinuclease ABC subunit C